MFANERHERILKLLSSSSSVTVSQLRALFGVSIETVRRDLEYLEGQGALARVHGGAVSRKRTVPFVPIHTRLQENTAEKARLSRTAAAFIQEGDTIAVDSGSTAVVFASVLLQTFSRLTVATNSPEVLTLLADKENFTLIQIGGLYLRREQAFYGHMAEEAIHGLHFCKAFVFPSTVSLQQGVGAFVHELVGIQRAYIQSADESFVLADSSKFEQFADIRVCGLSFLHLVTDDGLPEETFHRYKEKHIRISK